MPILPRLLLLLALFTRTLAAAEHPALAAARAADDERTAATIAADPTRLAAIFSDELHYAHSNGVIDDKRSYMDLITSGRGIYRAFDHRQRDFRLVAPGLVLMTGRVLIHLGPASEPRVNDLNYLAVWREEGGRWRFLAWQSCKNPPAAAPGK
jgi:hypothetical protein